MYIAFSLTLQTSRFVDSLNGNLSLENIKFQLYNNVEIIFLNNLRLGQING